MQLDYGLSTGSTLTVPLSTQEYKWVLADCQRGQPDKNAGFRCIAAALNNLKCFPPLERFIQGFIT